MKALLEHIENKKHVIWDWNGTLLNDLDHAVNTVNRMLKENGLPLTDLKNYRQIFGFPVIDYYRTLGFDTSPKRFQELCEQFNHYFYEGLAKCNLWPGAHETLKKIKLAKKTQSILSASEQSLLEHSAKRFGIQDLFDHLFGIFDKKAGSKVDRGHDLMKTAGIAPKHTIMFGDTDHDVEVGKALGIDVILVEHGHQTPERLRQVHSRVVKVF